MHQNIRLMLTLAALCASTQGFAAIAYDEAVSGDLSDLRSAPTPITFVIGDNDLLGDTGWLTEDDAYLDYATFIIPEAARLTRITVLPGTFGAEDGDIFFGLEAGPVVTVNPARPSETSLIGWNHFSEGSIGTQLLAGKTPIGPGVYSIWIQDYNEEVAPYRLRFTLESTAPVPEADTYAMMLAGLGLIGALAKRRR